VENGKEYRLVSLHERMQMFEPQKQRITKTKPEVHDIPEITVEQVSISPTFYVDLSRTAKLLLKI